MLSSGHFVKFRSQCVGGNAKKNFWKTVKFKAFRVFSEQPKLSSSRHLGFFSRFSLNFREKNWIISTTSTMNDLIIHHEREKMKKNDTKKRKCYYTPPGYGT